MKVAHITTISLSLRYLLLEQLRNIQAAGYSVTGISASGPDVSTIEVAGIRHIAVRMTRSVTPLADLRSLLELYRIMRRECFTIVHTHNPKPGFIGQIAAKLAGVPIIVNTVHGFYFHDHMNLVLRHFFITLEKIAALCSNVILSQNREDIETAIRKRICSPEKIKYLGNGIDLSAFDPDRINDKYIQRKRTELSIPSKAKVIGFVGRLSAKRKRFLDFLRAGQQVHKYLRNVCFLIIGDIDPDKSDALDPSVAKSYGVWGQCRFLGWRPNSELPNLYALMDVLVLPSLFEGIPRTVMEASSMRIPVVATNVKGNREAVEHGRNGYLVPLGNIRALANAIIELLTDSKKARRMGEEGRSIALERFDERLVFEKIRAEYARLLQKKGLASPKPKPFPPEANLCPK